MESSKVIMLWVALLASSVLLVSGAYTVDSSSHCTKEFIRRMAIEMCSRHKRSTENETKVDPYPLLVKLPIPPDPLNATVPSSLDTLFSGLLGPSDELKDLLDEQDLQRIERAEKTLMQCCVNQMCSANDFANAC